MPTLLKYVQRLELRSGPNVISWTVANNREQAYTQREPIRVARIDVVGKDVVLIVGRRS